MDAVKIEKLDGKEVVKSFVQGLTWCAFERSSLKRRSKSYYFLLSVALLLGQMNLGFII
jgi:hypothetical protein